MKNYIMPMLLIWSSAAFAQNLVVNPSFEQTSSNCGSFGGEGFFTDLANSWDNASNNTEGDSCSSPDLFSACNVIFGSPGPTHMPNSTLGYQYSRTGTRHAGIILHESLDEYREYIQGRTSTPLQAGQTYCVSFYVSLANDVRFACDNMGVYFGNTPYLRDPCPGQTNSAIYVTPQLNYDCAPLTDTANWVRLQWDYTAVGGEQYFMIGNFFNNANTNIVTNPGGSFINPYAYYYIDDVSITPSSCCYADLPESQVVCLEDAPFNLSAIGGVGNNCSNTVSGTWSGTGITNASAGTFNPATAGVGSHTLTYTMGCGFTGTTTIVVSGCAALTVCTETNGQLTVSGGVGPYTWSQQEETLDCSACLGFPFPACEVPPGCAVSTMVWTQFATGTTVTAPGTWPIQVADSDGGLIEITGTTGLPSCSGAPCELNVNLISSQAACDGQNNGTITVSASGNIGTVSYQWNSTPSQSSATASNLGPGNYTVTATDQSGCTDQLSQTIGTEAVTVNASDDQVICKGETTELSATGNAVSYVWNNGAGSGQTVTVGPGATITYTVTGTGANGCPGTDQVLVEVYEPPTVNLASAITTLCNNASPIQLMGTPSGGSYAGAGMNGDMFDPSVAGIGQHTITYTYYEVEECPGTAQLIMTVDLCTGISENGLLNELVVLPNPNDGKFTLVNQGQAEGTVVFSLTDLSGRTVKAPVQTQLKGLRLDVDMTELSAGNYLLTVEVDGQHQGVIRISRN